MSDMFQIRRQQRRAQLIAQLKRLGVIILVTALIVIALWGTTPKLP